MLTFSWATKNTVALDLLFPEDEIGPIFHLCILPPTSHSAHWILKNISEWNYYSRLTYVAPESDGKRASEATYIMWVPWRSVERDVNLRPGIQDFIQKWRSLRLQRSLTQKQGGNQRTVLLPSVLWQGLRLCDARPEFGQQSGKSAGTGRNICQNTADIRLRTKPQPQLHQMAVWQRGAWWRGCGSPD